MAKKAVTIPTALFWVFLMLAGIILLVLLSRDWLYAGNASISASEQVSERAKCILSGIQCIFSS